MLHEAIVLVINCVTSLIIKWKILVWHPRPPPNLQLKVEIENCVPSFINHGIIFHSLKGLFTQYNCSLRFSFKQSGLYNCVSYQHVAYITVLRTSIWKKTCNILELIPYIMMINCLINYMINYRCSLRACLACLERNEALQPWSSFKTRENN